MISRWLTFGWCWGGYFQFYSTVVCVWPCPVGGSLSSSGVTPLFFVFGGLCIGLICVLYLKAMWTGYPRKQDCGLSNGKWWLGADVALCPCVYKSRCRGRLKWCKEGHPGPSREGDSKCEKLCLAPIPCLPMWPKGPAPSIPLRPKWLSPPTATSGTSYEPGPSCWETSCRLQLSASVTSASGHGPFPGGCQNTS